MAVIDLREDPRTDMAIGQNIGHAIGAYAGYKISERRRQEAETALMKILQRRAADPENYTEDQALSDISGIPRYADLAAQKWMSNIQSQQERELQQARLESTRALTKWRSEGGARGAKGETGSLMTEYKALETQRNNLQKRFDEEIDPEQEKRIKQQMDLLDNRMDAITNQFVPKPGPMQGQGTGMATPVNAKVDAATGTVPVTGQPPQGTSVTGQPPSATPGQQQSSFGEMATQVADQWLKPPSTAPASPSKQAQTPSNLTFQRAGSFGGGYVPTSTPQSNKADAAIAKEIAPETQLAPATQAEPQSQEQYSKISSPEELDALPSGALFIAPNGELRRKK